MGLIFGSSLDHVQSLCLYCGVMNCGELYLSREWFEFVYLVRVYGGALIDLCPTLFPDDPPSLASLCGYGVCAWICVRGSLVYTVEGFHFLAM